jgi:uncharacterized membrane protein YhhN
MNRKNIILTLIFLVIVAGVLIGKLLDIAMLEYIFRPLIMIWITVCFLLNARKRSFRVGVLIAFFFSWLGDLLLAVPGEGENELFFYAGIGAFFLAQVAYIYVFLFSTENDIKGLLLRNPLWIIPLVGYGVLFYLYIHYKLEGVNEVIVMVYTATLVGTSMAALNRRDRVNFDSFRLVFAGSIFFLVSDSLMVINKFHTDFQYAGFLNMLTYMSAQYLIMRGLILERERPSKIN